MAFEEAEREAQQGVERAEQGCGLRTISIFDVPPMSPHRAADFGAAEAVLSVPLALAAPAACAHRAVCMRATPLLLRRRRWRVWRCCRAAAGGPVGQSPVGSPSGIPRHRGLLHRERGPANRRTTGDADGLQQERTVPYKVSYNRAPTHRGRSPALAAPWPWRTRSFPATRVKCGPTQRHPPAVQTAGSLGGRAAAAAAAALSAVPAGVLAPRRSAWSRLSVHGRAASAIPCTTGLPADPTPAVSPVYDICVHSVRQARARVWSPSRGKAARSRRGDRRQPKGADDQSDDQSDCQQRRPQQRGCKKRVGQICWHPLHFPIERPANVRS